MVRTVIGGSRLSDSRPPWQRRWPLLLGCHQRWTGQACNLVTGTAAFVRDGLRAPGSAARSSPGVSPGDRPPGALCLTPSGEPVRGSRRDLARVLS